MLLNLHVKNLALIDEADVNFGPGLNILSGETGAGKSVLIGSINLALGEKAQKDLLREGAEYALVELTFSVEEGDQLQALRELDVFPEDGQVLMTRRLMANGRSVCRINAVTVSAAMMRRVASLLIDIHGQHEHQSLLTKKNHIKYLDAWAKRDLEEKKKALASRYRDWAACRKLLEEFSIDDEQQKRELSFLQYEIDEITEAQLQPGEDEQLEAEFRRLSHGRKILDALAECRELCSDGSGSVSDAVGRAVRALLRVSEYDGQVCALADQLQEIDSLINDFNRDLCGYMDTFEFSEELFAEVESRLDRINHLKSKYGKTIELILEQKEQKEAEAERLRHYDAYRRDLEEKLTAGEQVLRDISGEVSEIRKSAADIFTVEMKNALRSLNFPDVRLELEFQRLDHYTENGWDDVRFLISTNPGEPLKPLDAVASGGELSRIMLALKTVLAENDEIETLIFDEIDSGISGRTAQKVAEKIKETAGNHQVICITHLPQIAAMADSHFLIEKTSEDLSTISRICLLNREESVRELARMLGGRQITESVMQTAREMKEMAGTLNG